MKNSPELGFESIAIRDINKGFTTTPHQLPIYATSSFEFESIDQGIDIFQGKQQGHIYSRFANPTVDAVAEKIAQLETFGTGKTGYGLMTSSGMSAISTAISGLLSQGDAILTQGNLYGGTSELLLRIFDKFGITIEYVDLNDLDAVQKALTKNPKIKAIYFETPSNPVTQLVDIKSVANFAKNNGLYTIVDNTFLTPYLQTCFDYPIDIVIHSTTKYLNGHGNSTAGAVVTTDSDLHHKIWTAMKLLGTNCNPFDAWLTNVGLKTLVLRMDRHSRNALELALLLEDHPNVEKVNYPFLKSHPQYSLAKNQMKAGGGMLSFYVKGSLQQTMNVLNALSFCTLAPTLGDTDTLVLHPNTSSHLNVDPKIREQYLITDNLVRLSVGLEKVEDIWADLEQALSVI